MEREGSAAAQTEASAMIDVGGYYHFKHHPERAVPVLLRPLGGRADGELRLRGHVLDVGKGRQEACQEHAVPAQRYGTGADYS